MADRTITAPSAKPTSITEANRPTIFDVVAEDYPHAIHRHTLEALAAAAARVGVNVLELKPNLAGPHNHRAEAEQGWRHVGLIVVEAGIFPVSQAVPSIGLMPLPTTVRAVLRDHPTIEPAILNVAQICAQADTTNLVERVCDTWVASFTGNRHVPTEPTITDLPHEEYSVAGGGRFVAIAQYAGQRLTVLTTAPLQSGSPVKIYARYWMDTDVHAFPGA